MGLDVYLYTKDQEEHNRLHSKEEADFYGGEDWPLYDSKTDEEKADFKANRKYPNYVCGTDVPSVKHGSDKLCNRRYLRSSYNGGGFDSAVPNMTGNPEFGFDWIFDPVKAYGDYLIPLDKDAVEPLHKARKKAVQVVEALKAVEKPVGVLSVSQNALSGSPTARKPDALDFHKAQMAKIPDMGSWGTGGWSSGGGDFFGVDGLRVLSAVPGVDILGLPAVHLVYALPEDAAHSYIETAEIVVEFIDEALELIKKDGVCFLHWSG